MTSLPASSTSANATALSSPGPSTDSTCIIPPHRHHSATVFARISRVKWKHKISFLVLLSIWLFTVMVVLSQALSAVFWTNTSQIGYSLFGHFPHEGLFYADGNNDEAYTDRVIGCVKRGRVYEANSIKSFLAQAAVVQNTTNDAYRLVTRTDSALDRLEVDTLRFYTYQCQILSATIDKILDTCRTFGFDVRNQNLRYLNGLNASQVLEIPDSLPMIIMPYWDNAPYARLVLPGQDGVACGFRLLGQYLDPTGQHPDPIIRIVAREKLVTKTREWLQMDGEWRYGWYETGDGQRWYSHVHSSVVNGSLGISDEVWNISSGSRILGYKPEPSIDTFGDQLTMLNQEDWFNSIAISNGARYGFFLYEGSATLTIHVAYNWQDLIANVTFMALMVRWLTASIALCSGYLRGECEWSTPQIGCLANSHSFTMLPVFFLPRLKVILAVFWSSGLFYEGDMRTFTFTWYLMYNSLAEFTFLLFSLINLVSRALCIRVSDALFAPTFLLLCGLHYFRIQIGFGDNGRVPTFVTDTRMQSLTLLDFLFVNDTNFDLCGRVNGMYAIKIGVLVANVVFPLLWFPKYMNYRRGRYANHKELRSEKVLALCAGFSAGLGTSKFYSAPDGGLLLGYELVRFGYLVYGDKYVMPIGEWYLVVFAKHFDTWGFRVLVCPLVSKDDRSWLAKIEYLRVRDSSIQSIPRLQVSCRTLI